MPEWVWARWSDSCWQEWSSHCGKSYTVAILYSIAAPIVGAASVLTAEAPERWRS